MRIPLLMVGDAPNLSSGLARIGRDLASLIYRDTALMERLDLAYLGLNWDGFPQPYRMFPIKDGSSWGEFDLPMAWAWHSMGQPGIVLSVWDPGRCWAVIRAAGRDSQPRRMLGAKLWGYFAIDGVNARESLGGPAAEASLLYDRPLAYGRWGSKVLHRICGKAVSYLPHGLDLSVFKPSPPAVDPPVEPCLIGCVATNQRRKDLGLLFSVWAVLAKADEKLVFWLHTDQEITEAWSIPQLAQDFGLNDDRLIVTKNLSDSQLAALYSQCLCTIAPGSGEGFCYPIAESLACGIPVVAIDYAGGAELLPMGSWRVQPAAWRLEGAYALKRPVIRPDEMAVAVAEAIRWKRLEPLVVQEYCRGSVAHLSWPVLWPRWRAWILRGLDS